MLAALAALALAQAVSPVADPSGPIFTNPATMSQIAATYLPTIATSDECTCAAVTGTHGEAITVSRSSSATCTKSDGTLVTCSADQPRVEADGLLVEASGTNAILRSAALDNASWSPIGAPAAPAVTADTADVTDPFSGNSAEKLVFGATTAASAYSFIYQGFTATAASWTGSIYLRASSGTPTVYVWFWNGASTRTGSTACTLSSTAWTRCGATATLTAATWYFAFGIDTRDAAQSGAGIASFTGYGYGAQSEASAFATSYIATAGTSATRAADVVTFPKPSTASTTEGCVALTFTPLWSTSKTNASILLYGNAAGTARLLYSNAGDTNINAYDGTSVSSVAAAYSAGVSKRYRTTWSAAAGALVTYNDTAGTTGTSAAFSGFPSFDSTWQLGSLGVGSNVLGHIKNIVVGKNAGACQ